MTAIEVEANGLMGKQLNIRSDEAYERAHRLAARNGMSVTEAVTWALRTGSPGRT